MNRVLPRLILLAVVVAGIILAVANRDALDAAALEAWVDRFGAAGPLIFMLLYAVATVLFLPGSVITLAGGALFGPVWGALYNLTGATLGALLAFLVARYLAADAVERRAGGRVKQLIDGVEREGWRFVAFTRLVPLFPFNLLNYALGLTRIRLLHYLLATYLCMLPGALAYTYLGYAGREAVAGGEGMVQKGLLALALLAVVAFLPRIITLLRGGPMMAVEELKRRIHSTEAVVVLDLRSAADFVGEQGHIAEALNIPLEELSARHGELKVHREQPLLLVCTTDRRSAKAARLLAAEGFTDLHVVKGGMTAWRARGWPTCTT